MSWYPEVYARFKERQREYLRDFHSWVREHHPEIMKEWEEISK